MTDKKPVTIKAAYRITTPMFCSGANQQQAELRLASFKGALRFWWRASMWGKVQDVEALREQEGQLFGSTKHGQSKVRMKLGNVELEPTVLPPKIFEKGILEGAHYLGYGVMEAFPSRKKGTEAGQLTRPMIPGGTFDIELILHPKISDDQIHQVRKALILLGTIGGLGSKSRKGYGSLTLTRLEDNTSHELSQDIAQRLLYCLPSPMPKDLPEWTAWSSSARVMTVTNSGSRAVEILDDLGREQVHYRCWGHNGSVLGETREGNFREDHDLSKGENVNIDYPKRVAFGLPHNYGKKKNEMVEPDDLDRRASPLFLHVHQPNKQDPPIGVVSLLPSRFLPDEMRLRAFGQLVPFDASNDFWQPIHGYLDRLIGKNGATEKRTQLEAEELNIV